MSCFRGNCFTSITRSRGFLQLQSSRFAHKNYYEALGITPKATQGDIKQAYYKLSLKYHPDIAAGEGERFREITAAYEVLGNLKLRRLYDRGALFGGNHPPPPESSEHTAHMNAAFYDEVRGRQKTPSTGRTAAFNFDDWSKAHYGRVMDRNERTKQKLEKYRQYAEAQDNNSRVELVALLLIFIVLGMGVSLMKIQTAGFDTPRRSKRDDR